MLPFPYSPSHFSFASPVHAPLSECSSDRTFLIPSIFLQICFLLSVSSFILSPGPPLHPSLLCTVPCLQPGFSWVHRGLSSTRRKARFQFGFPLMWLKGRTPPVDRQGSWQKSVSWLHFFRRRYFQTGSRAGQSQSASITLTSGGSICWHAG